MTDNPTPPDQRDEERLSRLSGGGTSGTRSTSEEALVREYESRYRPEAKPKKKTIPRSYSAQRVDDDDKLWASVAHASVWVTMALAVPTSGLSLPFVVFIPLILYFLFRKRSDYIAFHAMQAFVLQLVCTIGTLAVFIVGGTVWLIGLVIAALLMLVLVGFVILPLWVIIGMIASVILALLPLVGLVFATIAAVRVYTGNDYRYPYLADWVDRQIAGGFLNA